MSRISDLPHALRDGQQFEQRLDGRQPAVFLDYDGTLTPIVDRPEDAVISESMRDAVRRLAGRCTVCVVSGRDRLVVAQWMGIDDLVVAGSHGFDIGDQRAGAVRHEAATGFDDLLSTVIDRLCREVEPIQGVVVEPKRFSVAVHYRLAVAQQRPIVKAVVNTLLADYPDQLKVTPGKMVYEIQPKVDWDKGKAVHYLRQVLHVDGEEFVPLYLGDDITDEDAFRALKEPSHGLPQGSGIGVVVADVGDAEQAGRTTAADFVLESIGEVERFLNTLAR
ncbi:MAG: trehalose-phosphatase [Actinomycetota bacterium]|nr:trehalose-phosphatase [Actinomycetota bacterium]